VVPEHFPDLCGGRSEGLVKVDNCILTPDPMPQFLFTHNRPSSLQQRHKKQEGLTLQCDPQSASVQFASVEIDFIQTETDSF
jgi:hypothetical protein